MIRIGDVVYKKSRKPFQNGKRTAVIENDNCYIQTPKGKIDAVSLVGCNSPVDIRILRKDMVGLEMMFERDIMNPLGEKK